MGIDVYLSWDGQTDIEKKAQITGYSVGMGHVGYLREAYHGEPYATKELFGWFWNEEQPENGYKVSSFDLMRRLPAALEASAKRHREKYNENGNPDKPEKSYFLKSFVDFVTLHKRLEVEERNPRIIISR